MAVHGPSPGIPLNSSTLHTLTPLFFDCPSGPTEGMAATPPSAGRRSLMKTASLGNISAGRSFTRMTVCCQGTGIFSSLWCCTLIARVHVFLFLMYGFYSNCEALCFKKCYKNKVVIIIINISHPITGIRPVTQSMRLPKATITLTVTMMMTSSLSTATHGDHQREGCFLPHLKVLTSSYSLSPYMSTSNFMAVLG